MSPVLVALFRNLYTGEVEGPFTSERIVSVC